MVSCSEGGRPHPREGTVTRRIAANRAYLIPIYHENNVPIAAKVKWFINNNKITGSRKAGRDNFGT
jgi:hypothetical protein